VVVKSCYNPVVGCLVEHFAHLLEERFAVKLSCTNEGIFSEQDVLALESGVEVFIEEVEGLVVPSVEDNFDCVLQVNRHFLVVEVVSRFLLEALFSS